MLDPRIVAARTHSPPRVWLGAMATLRITPSSQGKFGMIRHPHRRRRYRQITIISARIESFCHLSEALKILTERYTARNGIGFVGLPNMASLHGAGNAAKADRT